MCDFPGTYLPLSDGLFLQVHKNGETLKETMQVSTTRFMLDQLPLLRLVVTASTTGSWLIYVTLGYATLV